MFGVEAGKATDRLFRAALTVLALGFALCGFLLQPISDAAPKVGSFIGRTFVEPASWFAIFLALFFVLRPYWTRKSVLSETSETATAPSPMIRIEDAPEFKRLLQYAENLAERVAETERAIPKISFNIGETTAKQHIASEEIGNRLAQIETDFAGMARHREQQVLNWEYAFADVAKRVGWLEKGLERVETYQAETYTRIVSRFDEIRVSFRAILHRERMRELASRIEEGAKNLGAPVKDGAKLDAASWAFWLRDEAAWRSLIFDWCQWAQPYMPRALAHIEAFDQRLYDRPWTILDEQFPTAAAVHKYKVFRLAHDNWRQIREVVARDVIKVAFDMSTYGEEVAK